MSSFVRNHTEIISNDPSSRSVYKYFLKLDGKFVEVCRTFFLATLGYKKDNNAMLQRVLSFSPSKIVLPADGRGKQPSANKIDPEMVRNHINLFNPCVSHYRRAHAPNRLYLR